MANTNSNIESFNAAIKRDFFNRKKKTVIGAVNKIQEIIRYYSVDDRVFHYIPKYVEKLNQLALQKLKEHICEIAFLTLYWIFYAK